MRADTTSTFRPLRPTVSHVEAADRLRPARHWWQRSTESRRLELIRLPIYVVEIHAELRTPDRPGNGAHVRLAVDALQGRVERLDRAVVLEDTDVGLGTSVSPGLAINDALDRVRTETPWITLPFSLRRGRAYDSRSVRLIDRIGYPYWVQHVWVRRFMLGGRRDFLGLDGISGGRLGPRARSLLVAGLIRLAHDRREDNAP